MPQPERYTSRQIITCVHRCFGRPDLDPASCAEANRTVRARRYFDRTANGLKRDWIARTVFLNPPFERGVIQDFLWKFLLEFEYGHFAEGIVIVRPGFLTSQWFWPFIRYGVQCVPHRRPEYVGPKGEKTSAPQGTLIFYLGNRREQFRSAFDDFGVMTAHLGHVA
jgi:ParB family chromosome partitioning protein